MEARAMGSRSKRQMTAAKRAREQALRDRRVRKQEKRQAAAALRAQADGLPATTPGVETDGSVERDA
jgi:hypothetical protein